MTSYEPAVRGVCPVLSSTFHDDGGLDGDSFLRLCEFLLSTGVHSVMIFGVATENAKLDDAERDLMLRSLVKTRGAMKVTIVATVADHGTDLAVARARKWVDMGADVINILPSYFLRPDPSETLEHLAAILDSVDVPVIIQSLPAGGDEVPVKDILALSHAHHNLSQVKVENVPATPLVSAIRSFENGKVSALVGWGGLEWKEASEAGAVGVQPGCSLTELYLRAQVFLDIGDSQGFETAFAPLRQPLTAWMRHPEVLIGIEKHILQQRGIIDSSRTRKPSAALAESDYAFANGLMALLKTNPGKGVNR